MLDAEAISSALEAASDPALARRRAQHVRPLKGLRGTPAAEVARLGAEAWATGVELPRDAPALQRLFSTAHEDGLIAIALAAAAAPDAPEEALILAEDWLSMVDDLETADALGWVLYGTALLAARRSLSEAVCARRGEHPTRRRAALMAAMAALPEPMSGPAAAALRARIGGLDVAVVGEPVNVELSTICAAYQKDPDPHVRKGLARILRTWGEHSPEAVEQWLAEAQRRGGIPKTVREEVERGVKRGKKRTAAP